MKYYISDLHIGHTNVIRYDNRPFENVEEMNKMLVRNWNSVINSTDEVYVLGDFAWKNALGVEVLKQLKGRKFLIKGNHDKINEKMEKYFEWIKDYAVIYDKQTKVVLFHYPIANWDGQYRGSVHLYGHIHNTRDHYILEKCRIIYRKADIPFECYNVGCMMPYINYTPRTLEEIRNNT